MKQKYELKRHTASHENITYKCPYCVKVVKRKPSILKHLRISHNDLEHLWSKGKFIDSLKHVDIVDIDEASMVDRSDDASQELNNSNGDNLKVVLPGACSTQSESDINFNSYATKTTNNYHHHHHHKSSNLIVVNSSKPKKSSAIINYLKKMNLNQMKKYLMKNPHKTTEQIKKKMKLSLKLSNADEMMCLEKKKIHKFINNNNNTIECSSAFNHKRSNKKSLATNEFVANTPPLSPKVTSTSHTMPLIIAANLANDGDENIAQIDQKSLIKLPPTSSSFQSTSQLCQQKSTVAGAEDVNVNNIIDDCFFVDDTLNCNIVLHSPFSSDNDVDGFIMSNSIEGENKELLNKFHDRLEEMEQKIDNSDFKVLWNQMLDDDNLNDDDENENGIDQMADDDDELHGRCDALDDSNDDKNNGDFNNIGSIKQPINEFA